MKIVLVANDHAGDAAAQAISDVATVLATLGTVSVATPRAPSFAADLNRQSAGADLIVVAGGDGSLNWVVNALRPRLDDLALALIPMGTGNDLARTLGLPREPLAATTAIVAGCERQIDYGLATGAGVERLFVNACVGGFPVAVDEALDAQTKDLLGSLAFWVAGVKALPHLKRATVTVNATTVSDCVVVVVGVGNGRTVGGGFPLFPSAAVDDGQLDACALAVDDLASAVRVIARVRSGSHSGLEEVVEQRAERIAIDADKAVEFNVDGELVGLVTPAVFERVGRLRLRAPSG